MVLEYPPGVSDKDRVTAIPVRRLQLQLQIPRHGRHARFGHIAAGTPPIHHRICSCWLLPVATTTDQAPSRLLFPRAPIRVWTPERWQERRRRPVGHRAPWRQLQRLHRPHQQRRRSSPSAAPPPPPAAPSCGRLIINLTLTTAAAASPRCPSSSRRDRRRRSGRRARARPPRTRAPTAAPCTGAKQPQAAAGPGPRSRSRPPPPPRRRCPAGSAPRGARRWPTRWCASRRWRAATTSGARWPRSSARRPPRRGAAPRHSAPRPAASPPCPRRRAN